MELTERYHVLNELPYHRSNNFTIVSINHFNVLNEDVSNVEFVNSDISRANIAGNEKFSTLRKVFREGEGGGDQI
jgi:hypothetical protein